MGREAAWKLTCPLRQVTEQRLAESSEQLTTSRARCDELRAKLARAKDNLRLAQLNAEEFKDKFVRVSDDMVRLRERFNQVGASMVTKSDSTCCPRLWVEGTSLQLGRLR